MWSRPNTRTNDLFLGTTFIWFQASARGHESTKSEQTLAVGGDTHAMDFKTLKMIGVQYLKP